MDFDKAINLIKKFKKDRYLFGENVLKDTGKVSCRCGNTAAIFRTTFKGSDKYIEIITDSLIKSGVRAVAIEKGSAPNAPREDLVRITEKINQLNPDMLISFGGGSTIDAVKAANVLYCLGGSIDEYFGAGIVSTRLKNQKKKLLCNIAVQTLAGSGAHLTKYSNITDTAACQKKLIIDDAIVPDYAIFDYSLTYNTPSDITCDGALDGLSHLIEVLFSLENKKAYIYIVYI